MEKNNKTEETPRERILQDQRDWQKNEGDVVKNYLNDAAKELGINYATAIRDRALEVKEETGKLPSKELLEKAKKLFNTLSGAEKPLPEEDNIKTVLENFLSSTNNKNSENKKERMKVLGEEKHQIRMAVGMPTGDETIEELEHLKIRIADFLEQIKPLSAKDAYWIPGEAKFLEETDKSLEDKINNLKSNLKIAA